MRSRRPAAKSATGASVKRWRGRVNATSGVIGASVQQIHVEGAAQFVGTPEFADQGHLRELLAAIEEKNRLVSVLNACIETPEPVFVQIGIKEISQAGHNLALISAPYSGHDQVQGSLGVLGPRIDYERAPRWHMWPSFRQALQKIE
jgi:transcriptional regulator of heat shock response